LPILKALTAERLKTGHTGVFRKSRNS